MKFIYTLTTFLFLLTINSQEINEGLISNLKFRNIGPANTSGRIASLAINDKIPGQYFVGVASGGVWRTDNWGTTYEPIFDNEGSYSIGTVVIDPSNPKTIWVGTGENNNQRSVAYGDGVYRSLDGGNTWKNMGLKTSEHISRIIVDPNNYKHIYVAAYGPLWNDGGERGIYESFDHGETWERILNISEQTGISDLVMDPSNPLIMYAAAHQRRRHVWTYIDGGPENKIHKTEDGGKTWKELSSGLPSGLIGRIGLAIAPSSPNIVYAIINGEKDNGGFYKSDNYGETWNKQSDRKTSGNYYQEIYVDPLDENKIFSMDTWLHHSEDGGKTFQATGESNKHVDNHAIWINPKNTNHWLVGCDGGIYETWDHANTWQFKPNLPIVQFYRVAVDNDLPFYNVYGGTQDNNSMGGPSATINNAGILNSDWYITNGGDGFESQIDPLNPNIVYAQSQYGWLVRYDRQSGEKTGIQPIEGKGEPAYRWNWDAPLLISPHNNKTLYFAANKLFKSTDRGNTWKTISGDLSQQIDRNKLEVMGRVWSKDAPMKNKSTTIYGNIVALDESPIKQGLLYVGTDDGLIQVSEDDGATWIKISEFPGIPEGTYVNGVYASKYDQNVVFAVFNNHKNGDFKPYILKSTDKGKSWESISSNLPTRGTVYCLAQDHVVRNLLFCGTEFGAFTSNDGGENWYQLKGGLPTIAVKDMAIQERENDLVLASFGRGFYVLDNYSVLREIEKNKGNKEAIIYSIKDALQYKQSSPLGLRGVGSQGASMYASENPKFGAVFTYYIPEKYTSLKSKREKKEKSNIKDGLDNHYPTMDEIRAENKEEKPELVFIISNSNGQEIRRIIKPYKDGLNRINWDLRLTSTSPIKLKNPKAGRYSNPDVGPMVVPGDYYVKIYKLNKDGLTSLSNSEKFIVKWLDNQTIINENTEGLKEFQEKTLELKRKINGTQRIMSECSERLKYLEQAAKIYPNVSPKYITQTSSLKEKIDSLNMLMYGDDLPYELQMESPPSISDRIGLVFYQIYGNRSAPTQSQKDNIAIAQEEYNATLPILKSILEELSLIEREFSDLNVPFTKGRKEDWKQE
jgi:photosystem II stability/assembly factor-like uncharacterized protein